MDVDAHEPVHCNKYAGIYACTCVHVQTFVPCTSCLYVYIYIHTLYFVGVCMSMPYAYVYIYRNTGTYKER